MEEKRERKRERKRDTKCKIILVFHTFPLHMGVLTHPTKWFHTERNVLSHSEQLRFVHFDL